MLRRVPKTVLIVVIVLSVIHLMTSLMSCRKPTNYSSIEQHVLQVEKIVSELHNQQIDNNKILNLADEMRRMRRNIEISATTTESSISNPSKKFEQTQIVKDTDKHLENALNNDPEIRGILNDAIELQYTFNAKFALSKRNSSLENIKWMVDQQNAIINNVKTLLRKNEVSRQKAAGQLQELVQRRIRYLQNPKSCGTSRKLFCYIHKNCGFGCQLHHVNYCLMNAYGTRRTMILVSKAWQYNPGGWEQIFQPLSDTCLHVGIPAMRRGALVSSDDLNVMLPPVDRLLKAPKYVPLAIPEDLAPQLTEFHGSPGVWWVGQFIRYLFRPQPWLRDELTTYETKVNYSSPIVGVQVRRSDKIGKEASFHGIDEYMKHVDLWYDRYDQQQNRDGLKPVTRRIYLATDDASVLRQAKSKFPNYEFTNFEAFAKTAGSLLSRYSTASLRGVVADIYLLSKCSYLVCTFSSQVCRVAYELMQTLHPDASRKFHSLDDVYYYGGQTAHEQVAVLDHEPRPGTQEIQLKVGDVVVLSGNHWDGYSKGKNIRTKKTGLYPSYKVQDKVPLLNYPTYPEANNLNQTGS